MSNLVLVKPTRAVIIESDFVNPVRSDDMVSKLGDLGRICIEDDGADVWKDYLRKFAGRCRGKINLPEKA